MSLEVTFHCEHCRERHDLKNRLSMYNGFIEKAQKVGDKKDVQRLKAAKNEIEKEIEKISILHGSSSVQSEVQSDQKFFEG